MPSGLFLSGLLGSGERSKLPPYVVLQYLSLKSHVKKELAEPYFCKPPYDTRAKANQSPALVVDIESDPIQMPHTVDYGEKILPSRKIEESVTCGEI